MFEKELTSDDYIRMATQEGLDYLEQMSEGDIATFRLQRAFEAKDRHAVGLEDYISSDLGLSGYQFNSAARQVIELAPLCDCDVSVVKIKGNSNTKKNVKLH